VSLGSARLHRAGVPGLSGSHGWLAWLRHAVPIAYFAGLLAWEVSAGFWANPLGDPGAAILSGSTILYLALIIGAYLRRGPAAPLRRGDALGQAVALLGANLLTPLSLLPLTIPDWENLAVGAGILGVGLCLWALWHLGTAFSLVPEARHLVQSGPYRWVRHPLYLAGFIIGLGLLVVKLSPAALGLFLAFAVSQAMRMDNEERVLTEALPEYGEYRQRTAALLPHIF
jgi:protein-S-isoprenylcysteine O-methyltransferase Ste14